jgi:predicted SAM-dependent methyltransferase
MKELLNKIPFLKNQAKKLRNHVNSIQGKNRLKNISASTPVKLVIGASGSYDKGWIDTDIEYLNLLVSQHWETYFQKNSIDAILAEHVWEHLNLDNGLTAAKRCFEYLKPGGYLRVAVPDGFCPDKKYIDDVKPGGTGAGADDHKVLYNHKTFVELFAKAGFRAELLEYYDMDGKFHCVNWNPENGKIWRSKRFDDRNKDGTLNYTSLILDLHKNA